MCGFTIGPLHLLLLRLLKYRFGFKVLRSKMFSQRLTGLNEACGLCLLTAERNFWEVQESDDLEKDNLQD